MKLFYVILFSFFALNVFGQTQSFKCLETKVYSIGCTTCDNSRTGKMITGIEVNINGRLTELISPIIVKYTTTTVTLIDYKFTTATLTLAETSFATITDILNAIKICSDIGYSAAIDTMTYSNDTLSISFTNDSLHSYKVKIPDDQTIDTISYASDTLTISLQNDGQAAKKVYISGGTGSPKIDTFALSNDSLFISLLNDNELKKSINLSTYRQTLTRSFDTIFISGGNYILLPVDINTDNQAHDTIQILNDTIYLSLEGDLIPVHKLNLKPYLDNTDSQYFDTCAITNDTLFISIYGDGRLRKAIDLTPYLTDTDQDLSFGTKVGALVPLNITSGAGVSITGSTYIDIERNSSSQITIKNLGDTLTTNEIQTIDTFSYSLDTIRISLTQDNQKYKSIYVPSDTDDQSLSYGTKTGNTIPLNIQSGSGVNIDQGTNIDISRDASNYITIRGTTTIDTFTYASDTIKISLTNDAQAAKKIYVPQITDTDDQYIDTMDISGNNLRISLQGDNQALKTVSLAPFLDNTDSQVIDTMDIYGGVFLRTSISGDGQAAKLVDLSNFYNLLTVQNKSGNILPLRSSTVTTDLSVTEGDNITLSKNGTYQFTIDARPTVDTFTYSSDTLRLSIFGDQQKYKSVYLPANTDAQTLSITAGKGTISISGGNSIQLADSSATNEIQTIDTFSYSLDTIRLSIANDNQKYKSIYIPSISDTDDQNLSFGTKSGVTIPLNISDGAGVNFDEGTNIEITRDASNYITFKGKTTLDTVSVVSDTARISLTNDAQKYKIIPLSEYRQTIDTFNFSFDTIRISLSGDNQKYKSIYIPNVTDTDDQYIDTMQLSGNNLQISLQGDNQALKSVDLTKFVDTTFARNGTRISNDSLYWGSQSSTTDNGSALIHDTYIWQGGNDISFFNNGDGPDKPVLYLSAVNDLWIGANSTSTAGTAGTAGKPSVYFRYGSSGAYSFGVNTASNLNALGSGAVNFGINGLASASSAKNFGEDGIASSTHAINLGRSGEAKTDSYAWNSGAFGSAANFAAWNSGYDGDATNYYAFNTARVGLASGYSSVNMGESGVASGSDAKNFGNGGQASGTHAIGFSKFNVTSGNYGMNGSYYTESHAYGQSRWGYFGTDHNSQSSSGWVADNILFAIDNGKEDTVRSSALTVTARGWFQLRDIGTTQTNISSAKQIPKSALEIVSTESGFIPSGGTLSQRNTIWNEGSQTGNFTATYTKGWQSITGTNIMDQNGLQFQVMNEYGGTSLYALRYNGSGYYWHQIY